METKKYLKWYQKAAYGSGDFGGNFVYTFITSFIMVYMTDTVGLNSLIIGNLILVSKLLDGVSDVIFGSLLDRTHSKMGKARPWLFWSTFPLAICEILLFAVPEMGETLQYAYFFVIYVLLNVGFYTAQNISYSSLTALATRNGNERVQMGSIRFIFASAAALIISTVTMNLVQAFGGGVTGWRTVAIMYAAIMMICYMLVVFFVRELPEEETAVKTQAAAAQGNPIQNVKYLFANRYYLLILAYYLLYYITRSVTSGTGIYFCRDILGNSSLLGVLTLATMLPAMAGLTVTPLLTKKFTIHKVTTVGLWCGLGSTILMAVAGYQKNVPLLFAFLVLQALCICPMTGSLNAIIADAAHYTYLKHGAHIEGTMYSCSSVGQKLGGGIGSALLGWLLAFGHYNGSLEVQTPETLGVISFTYLIIPVIIVAVLAVIVTFMDVRKANEKLEKQQ